MSTKGTHIPDWLQVPFAGITPAPSQQKGQDLFPTGNWRAIRPVYRDKLPPCNNACGTNEKIQGYLDLVKRGKYLDAYALIKEDMPFPSVTGRVCYHPCEQACNRGQYDEAISIRAVERFLGDLGQALPRDVVKAGPPNGKKVAIVGSGPAGHSAAYQLARLGYEVTIFEKSPRAGGLNRGGIPDWVLPQDVLDREIERLVELGITIKTNTAVGKDVTWDDLKKHYDAVVLAVGLIDPNSARRGRRQGRRRLRTSVPARHRHGHVEGDARPARRRHRRGQHGDRLRARSAPPGRRRGDDDHRRGQPDGDAVRAGGSARHARARRRADARPRRHVDPRQRQGGGAAAPPGAVQRRDQRVADRDRSRRADDEVPGGQRDNRRRPARVARVAARRVQDAARHDRRRSLRAAGQHDVLRRGRRRTARRGPAADGRQRGRRRQARRVQPRQSRARRAAGRADGVERRH